MTDCTGFKIAAKREALGLSQSALATRAGLSRAEINMIERGRITPRIDTLKRIAVALRIETKELV